MENVDPTLDPIKLYTEIAKKDDWNYTLVDPSGIAFATTIDDYPDTTIGTHVTWHPEEKLLAIVATLECSSDVINSNDMCAISNELNQGSWGSTFVWIEENAVMTCKTVFELDRVELTEEYAQEIITRPASFLKNLLIVIYPKAETAKTVFLLNADSPTKGSA
ncbi:MAG: hypothetical protein ACI9H6_000649 [Patiriisocius sp.]|jgi:hypothetical protein